MIIVERRFSICETTSPTTIKMQAIIRNRNNPPEDTLQIGFVLPFAVFARILSQRFSVCFSVAVVARLANCASRILCVVLHSKQDSRKIPHPLAMPNELGDFRTQSVARPLAYSFPLRSRISAMRCKYARQSPHRRWAQSVERTNSALDRVPTERGGLQPHSNRERERE